MKPPSVLFCLAGTTGDVVPAFALAAHLRDLGVRVSVATHRPYGSAVERLKLTYLGLPYSEAQIFGSVAGLLLGMTRARAIAHAAGTVAVLRRVQEILFQTLSALRVSQFSAVVYTPLCSSVQYFCDVVSVPAVALHFQTSFPTSAHGSPYLSIPTSRLASVNRISFETTARLAELLIAPKVRREGTRHSVALPESNVVLEGAWRRAAAHVQAVSPWLTSDVPASGYGEHRTGFLKAPRGSFAELPAQIVRLRQAGERIVYFGTGSLPTRESGALVERLREHLAHRKCVLALGDRNRLTHRGPEVVDVVGVSHESLFPHLDAAVVAGGSGTISAALRHAVPLVVLPHWFDQFVWRHILQERALAAPATPPLGRWHDSIGRAIEWALSDAAHAVSRHAAAKLAAEDGAAAAAEVVTELLP